VRDNPEGVYPVGEDEGKGIVQKVTQMLSFPISPEVPTDEPIFTKFDLGIIISLT